MKKIFTIFTLALFIAWLLPLVTHAGGGFYDTEVLVAPQDPSSAYTINESSGVGMTEDSSRNDSSALAGLGNMFQMNSQIILWILAIILVGLLIWSGYTSWKKHQMPM